MEQYVIKGGNPLVGEVEIGGAKNAALAILTAAIMTDEPVLIDNMPDVSDINVLLEAISVNMIANFFGLGAAATPAGLKAMEELERLEDDRRSGKASGPARKKGIASNEMCTFLIVNISSLQLIPVNVIAYRGQYGSVNPVAIVGPAIAATAVSTLAGILFCKMMDRGA